MLTDGKPNDLDYYEGRYGIEDTRQAILEARHSGLSVFGITIDSEAPGLFSLLFGRGGYAIISRPDRLAHLLQAIYRQLVQLNNPFRFSVGAVPLAIALQIIRNASNRFGQVIDIRQEHDAEMIRIHPVETGSLY